MNGSVELTYFLPLQRSNMDHLQNTQFSGHISSQSPGIIPPVIPGNCYSYLQPAESSFTRREARINSMMSLINIPLCNNGTHITNSSFSSGFYNSCYASQINWNGESVQGTLEYDLENVNTGKFQDILECGSDTVLNNDVAELMNGSWGQILDGMIVSNSQPKVII
jgi:hypothetical protein